MLIMPLLNALRIHGDDARQVLEQGEELLALGLRRHCPAPLSQCSGGAAISCETGTSQAWKPAVSREISTRRTWSRRA
ncbi:hypothetical protein F1721_18830 [Saccharopolyspora hirsuta]|uniref:Uncharacterized protein n=1 Tax=Saccharopolyspora hirsuta TaxID=1837 RepID=A0A5M7BRV1_SACHI|nr:hypothetical protein [Saccharopolyspora hirsuta]KAA5831880.1 hypothetical protein F1721_18830 [Saccharopolyspora hirsuta]